MPETTIRISDLGKSYAAPAGPPTFSDAVLRAFRKRKAVEPFHALKDVSFSVAAGEVVGIVGHNGAGKSTLLKILSGITAPSRGRIETVGRIGSLLEVGTGFHPELTGRENIFMNGAILGMSRAEIAGKLDQIVAFADMGQFLDMRVKNYSSGMYARLAFAVAAHLDVDILVVDEVLAVGDAAFQRRCIDKMSSMNTTGRTVLFVSHNMQAVKNLCSRVIVLDHGSVAFDGGVEEGISTYLRLTSAGIGLEGLDETIAGLPDDPDFDFLSVSVSQNGHATTIVESGREIEIEIGYEVKRRQSGLRVFFDVCDSLGTLLLRSFHDEQAEAIPVHEPGRYVSRGVIPAEILGPSSYILIVRAAIYGDRTIPAMATFEGQGIPIPLSVVHTGTWNRAYPGQTFRAKLAIPMRWTTDKIA